MIWDTGSDWLVVETSDCTDCIGDTFDVDASTSFAKNDPTETISITLGDGTQLTGDIATDKACITQDDASCIDNF